MKFFVTGATGFVGGRVVRQLVEAGHQVVVIARTPAKAGDLLDLGISVHQGDVTEKESMRTPMQGADGVFHIAGWYKVGVKDISKGISMQRERDSHQTQAAPHLPLRERIGLSIIATDAADAVKLSNEGKAREQLLQCLTALA